jgi:uncharacterized protein (DUF2267 family)
MNRKEVLGVVGAAALASGVGLLETVAGRRVSRRLARAVARTARYQAGRLEGLRYRLAGRHPSPDVDDNVLADRVRSVLGPIEHRLDVPRVHVQVHAHEVLLHGEVATQEQARIIVHAIESVPGVRAVRSRLHVGLFAGDTQPSEGAMHPPPSEALTKVLAAAHGAGAAPGTERAAVRSVMSLFTSMLPPGERRHLLSHLPTDLRVLAEPPRPRWLARAQRPIRRLEDFARAVLPGYDHTRRVAVLESVIGAVRDLVPEEAADVAAVLPAELRDFWKTAVPAA